jgi:hypothetical protein
MLGITGFNAKDQVNPLNLAQIRFYNMSNRRQQSSVDIDPRFVGGMSSSQLAVSQMPESFSYGGLEDKYPTRSVRPIVPEYIQAEIDEEEVARKAEDLNNRLRESQLQRMNRQITLEDAELKKMIATDKDIAEAQAEISSLNPQSETYLQDRVKFSQKYPLAASSREYKASVLDFIDQQNAEWKRQQGTLDQGGSGLREYQNAMNEISKYMSVAEQRKLAPEEMDYLSEMQYIIDQYKAKRGNQTTPQTAPMPQATPQAMPQPQVTPTPGFQPIQGTTGQRQGLGDIFGP